jgi:hypothetical protein
VLANGDFFMKKSYTLLFITLSLGLVSNLRTKPTEIIPSKTVLETADRFDTAFDKCFEYQLSIQECKESIFDERNLNLDEARLDLRALEYLHKQNCTEHKTTKDCNMLGNIYRILRNKEKDILREIRNERQKIQKMVLQPTIITAKETTE